MNKIKETYLLMLIVIGLISLSLYSTYALFTASTEINDVVSFEASLTTNSNILEYEIVTVPAGETKIIELNITNSYGSNLYYGAWYNIINPIDTSDISVGLYTEKNSNPSSGQLASGASISLLVGISNYSTSEAVVNIGTVGSLTSNLNLSENRILLPSGWDASIVVTEQYLEDHTTTESVNLEYTTAEMTEVTLDPGIYLLETWGAEGGSTSTSAGVGGLGGYSYGTLTLYETTPTYVYVGGKSTINSSGSSSGGFNGGGKGTYYGGSGGGASDIRIGTDSLYARVIVAGGGGGAQGRANTTYQADGGYGGGVKGGDGEYYNGNTSTTFNGKGATLTAGGAAGDYSTSPAEAGTFGQGGAAGAHSSSTIRGLGAGGGGWYGGGGGAYRYAGGGGGSGFVYTEENAVYTDSSYTGGTWLLDSRYYLTNAATIGDGTTTFTDFDGTSVTGHAGAGAVRISGNKVLYSIPVIKGLDDLVIYEGTSSDLTNGVTVVCAYGETGCSLAGTSITDTSSLTAGTHTIYYVVQASNGIKYKYSRVINVIGTSVVFTNYKVDGTTTTTFPTTGSYTIEPNCTGATVTYDYSNDKFKIFNTSTSDVISCSPILTTTTKTSLANYIINLLGTNTSVASESTTGNGSTLEKITDNGETDYRYRGINPANYIMFNNELWRIIGVFDENTHGITGTNLVKIIRNDSIGSYVWGNDTTNSSYGNNSFSDSDIYQILNTAYYNASDGTDADYCYSLKNSLKGKCDFTSIGIQSNYRSMIEKNVVWYLAGYNVKGTGAISSKFYEYERNATYSIGSSSNPVPIGLMYVSDYGYAAPSTCTNDVYNYSNSGCADNDWLKKDDHEWTITKYSSNSYEVFSILASGNIFRSESYAYNTSHSRPVLYLNSSVYYLSGTGTQIDPYIVAVD